MFQAEITAIRKSAQMLLRAGWKNQTITFYSDSQASLAALNKMTVNSDAVEKCLNDLNILGKENQVHLRWVKAHVGIHGNEIADFLAKKGSSLQNGPMDQLLIPRAKQKTEISNYFQTKWCKAWKSYEQARQTKIWFPKPNLKKSQQLLNMSRKTLGKLVQFLTGHNKLKRHKNLQDGINDPYSCRLCLEEEESSFHVIAECPATQLLRTKIFDLPTPSTLQNPPDWRVSQVARFLKESSIGNMLEQN